jgi:hypothetical protein
LLVEPSDQWADSFPTCAGAKSTCMPTCPLESGPKYLLAPHPIDGPRETLASPIHWPPPLPSNPLPLPHDNAGGRRAGEWAHGRRGGGSGPRRGNGKRRRQRPPARERQEEAAAPGARTTRSSAGTGEATAPARGRLEAAAPGAGNDARRRWLPARWRRLWMPPSSTPATPCCCRPLVYCGPRAMATQRELGEG